MTNKFLNENNQLCQPVNPAHVEYFVQTHMDATRKEMIDALIREYKGHANPKTIEELVDKYMVLHIPLDYI